MMSNQVMPGTAAPDASRGCGERLRKAREAAGLTVAEVGARLKMPVRVVESLEAEDWSRLGAPVFVRGQLRSYGRLLGLTTGEFSATTATAIVEPSVIVPRTFTPPMQRAAEQIARRLVYIVITAAIAVPVWLATRPHLGLPAGDAAPLDLPAGALGARSADSRVDARIISPTPVVASMASMPRPVATPGLSLQFNADSWVQVTSPDGTTLEKSLVPKGQHRAYRPGEVGRVVLGNGSAVEVRNHGQVQDVTPYLRANVARFTVSSDGSLVPVAE